MEYKNIKPGDENKINVIIEISCGSKNKYEYDKQTGLIKLDRVLRGSNVFPCNYGFVPNTLCEDNDPLDVFVITEEILYPNILVEVRPIGVLHMIDNDESDAKIIAVPISDGTQKEIKSLDDLKTGLMDKIIHFLTTYKMVEQKETSIKAIGDIEDAKRTFRESLELCKG